MIELTNVEKEPMFLNELGILIIHTPSSKTPLGEEFKHVKSFIEMINGKLIPVCETLEQINTLMRGF